MNVSFYTYAYLRSKSSKVAQVGTPYYIGKGCGNRLYSKHKGISIPKDRTKIVILEDNLTEVGAFSLERRYIRWYGRKDLGTGILLNRTDGGEGGPRYSGEKNPMYGKIGDKSHRWGTKHTIETKNKIGISKKGKSSWNKGVLCSEETKTKIKKSKEGECVGINNHFFGKKHNTKTLNKMISYWKNVPIVTCPHCRKEGKGSNMKRYHFSNCKSITNG